MEGKNPSKPVGSPCVIECYLNQTSVLKNGDLDKTTAVTVLGASMDVTMKKILTTAIDICWDMQQAFEERVNQSGPMHGDNKHLTKENDMDKIKGRPQVCGRAASFVVRCVELEMFKNCPATNKVASEDCDALAPYIDTCM